MYVIYELSGFLQPTSHVITGTVEWYRCTATSGCHMAFGHLNSLEWQAFYPPSHFQATPYLNCIFVKVKSFILRDSRSEDRGRIMQWLCFVVFETQISKIQLVNGKKKVMYRTTALDHFASSGCASVWTSVFTCLLLILGTPERFKENHFSDDFIHAYVRS